MTHANAPLTPTGRLRLAKLIVDGGWPVRRAAERFLCRGTGTSDASSASRKPSSSSWSFGRSAPWMLLDLPSAAAVAQACERVYPGTLTELGIPRAALGKPDLWDHWLTH